MHASLLLLGLLSFSAQGEPSPRLERVAVVATAAKGTEIVAVQAATARLVLTHSESGELELFDLSDPAKPKTLRVIPLGLEPGEELTSVALPPSGDWCLAAIKAQGALAAGRAVAHSLDDGRRLASFPCGVGPDSVVIAPSGKSALVANEAEGFDEVGKRLISPPGSLTWIEFQAELERSRVTQLAFDLVATVPTDGRTIEREVDGETVDIELAATPEFLEPEVVLFLPGEERALVSLQENNLVAFVRLSTGKLERYLPLGNTEHAADVHDDGRFDERATLLARREPDGIALTVDGRYFLTADEGDTDPNHSKTPPGRPASGGRTLSVFDLEGRLIGDTKSDLDRLAALFDLYPDKRSPKHGSEPEMVVAFALGERSMAAVTLERAGALALVDLGDPAHPKAVSLAKTGERHLEDAPEGLAHYRYPATQTDYLYVANEGTGTLGVLRVVR